MHPRRKLEGVFLRPILTQPVGVGAFLKSMKSAKRQPSERAPLVALEIAVRMLNHIQRMSLLEQIEAEFEKRGWIRVRNVEEPK